MKNKLLIYGFVALITIGVGLFLINGQAQQENAARVSGGGAPSASVGENVTRTFGK